MKRFIQLILLILVGSSQIVLSGPGDISSKNIQCLRTNEKITVDGILSEDIWKRKGYADFYQEEPEQGEPATYKSEAWFAYDDENLYFAAKFSDPCPDSVLARLVRRDFVWGDPSDGMVLYLDTYHDHRSGYFFYVSAAGTLADGTLENDNKQTDLTWDAVWEGVPHFDSDGWSVEVRIPLSQLRFQVTDVQTWGFNIERYFSRKGETDMVAFTPRNESGFNSRFPNLTDIKGIMPSKGIELLPYITGKAEYIGNDPNDPFNGSKYLPGVGLDMKISLTNSLSFNGTINPDFGQVEVDPAVVNLSDVESSFQEKRPFFTEGVNIFRFGGGGTSNNPSFNWQNPNIFYSRRIGRAPQRGVYADYSYVPNGAHILGAGKVSGQIFDDWKIGTIHALTNRENADVSIDGIKSKMEVEPLTYYGVLRMQKDFNSGGQGLGFLTTFTNRFFKDLSIKDLVNQNAGVIAADGWTALDENRTYVLTGWVAASHVSGTEKRITALQRSSLHYFQRPDVTHLGVDSSATSLTGYAGRIMLNKNKGQWTLNSAIGFLSPKFEINDLGYGSYSDLINMHIMSGYRWNNPTDFYRNCGFSGAAFTSYDFGGNNTLQGYYFGSYINFLDLSGAGLNMDYYAQSYNARLTRGGPLTLNPNARLISAYYNTNNRLWWVLNLNVTAQSGNALRYVDYYAGFELKVTPTLTLNIGSDFNKSTYNAQWLTSYIDPTAVNTYNRRYVFAQLNQTTLTTDIRADWIITPNLSVQVYIQPLIAAGKYSNYKNLNRPKSYDFTKYGTAGSTITKNTSPEGDVSYSLDPDGTGPSPEKTIYNPDFKMLSLRGNAVLRWEYMPGSALFLVWTQSRQDMDSSGDFEFNSSVKGLVDIHPDNIFMLKLTYWLGT
ncbi:MAG: DUF5916 domain-containing protein [Bacteroidota bacterium]|nr:DUF5916 domain-containing protein [Bacteroidota bacterium]